MTCNDNNACTTDSCDSIQGCKHTPRVCNDNNACTSDSCSSSTGCIFIPINIDDGDSCTIDQCTPSGGVTHTIKKCANGSPCINGNCPSSDTCSTMNNNCFTYQNSINGCIGTAKCGFIDHCNTALCNSTNGNCYSIPKVCDDGNANTYDWCDSLIGCQSIAITPSPTPSPPSCEVRCDDGDSCTTDFCDFRGDCYHYIDHTICNPVELSEDSNWTN